MTLTTASMTLTTANDRARAARLLGKSGANNQAGTHAGADCTIDGSAPPSTPASPTLAGAYLNQFNRMVDLLERLPSAPELIGDLLNWHPTSYHDYFAGLAMPGRASAADVYAALDQCLRKSFEGVAADLDRKALGAAAAIRRHFKTHGKARPDLMTDICERAGTHLHEALGKASAIVNHAPAGAGHMAKGPKAQASQA